MPKIDTSILDEEVPSTSKQTIQYEDNKNSLSIYDLVKKEKKSTKEQVGVTLEKEIVDKLKTVVIDTNSNMSKLFESLLTPLLKDIEIKEENIKVYDKKNKAKGKRTKK